MTISFIDTPHKHQGITHAEVEEEGFINRLVDPDLEIMEEDAGPELPATDLSEVLADEDT